MIAISTKYHGPTNSRGSRISANANGHRVTVPYDHALGHEGNHAAAAIALCQKMHWRGELVSGGTGDGYVFCFLASGRYLIPSTETVNA